MLGGILKIINRIQGKNLAGGDVKGFLWYCPGCKRTHGIYYEGSDQINWSWNGSEEKPTLSPSVLVNPNNDPRYPRCHCFMREGILEFLRDCTHELAGQKVPMVEFRYGHKEKDD